MAEMGWVLLLGDRRWPLRGTTTIGRAPEADVRIDDPSVSRKHAHIVVDASGALLVDTSRNGVRVNRIVVSGEMRISHGDRIEIGAHVLEVVERDRQRRERATTQQHKAVRHAVPPGPLAPRLIAAEDRPTGLPPAGVGASAEVTAEHPILDDD